MAAAKAKLAAIEKRQEELDEECRRHGLLAAMLEPYTYPCATTLPAEPLTKVGVPAEGGAGQAGDEGPSVEDSPEASVEHLDVDADNGGGGHVEGATALLDQGGAAQHAPRTRGLSAACRRDGSRVFDVDASQGTGSLGDAPPRFSGPRDSQRLAARAVVGALREMRCACGIHVLRVPIGEDRSRKITHPLWRVILTDHIDGVGHGWMRLAYDRCIQYQLTETLVQCFSSFGI